MINSTTIAGEATSYETEAGKTHPLGSLPDENGVNFSLYSDAATEVELLVFDSHDTIEPSQTFHLDPIKNKSFHFWHIYVVGLKPGAHYAYRVSGPHDVGSRGDRYNRNKVLIDPYALGNTDDLWDRGAACNGEDNLATSMRSVVIDASDYDWEGDKPINRPMEESIIYEMHVAGFTKSPTSGVERVKAGTYTGLIEKIPYLQELGITAVELLPVFDFDIKEGVREMPDGSRLCNYWGYSTVGFFAPHSSYCMSPHMGQHLNEFRDMVKAYHRAGIEVILDVVYNHSSEGNENGPTISFKGLANSTYYILPPEAREYYMNYTGCGNTINANHPMVQKFILDSLEYWVREMHVDGFRFDEAVILTRDENGAPLAKPPVIWQIELSETLADTKVIAECWDAAGENQLGHFPGYRWGEWNGYYRDAVRRFIKGDSGVIGELADAIAGSANLFSNASELPINSINFVTCHDGFSLNDLVSYNEKHNWANGEDNNDGASDNLSWNCGAEGPTDDPAIEKLRNQQVKNFAALLMLSQGVPMICGGDEVRRTQGGNNNAYCHDDAISWFDWELVEKHADCYRFFSRLIQFRKSHPTLRRANNYTGQKNERGLTDISWHGCQLNAPGWDDPQARALAFTMAGFGADPDLHVMMNMHWEPLTFDLPEVPGRDWHRSADTSLVSPEDISEPGDEIPVSGNNYIVTARSVVVLISKEKQSSAPAGKASLANSAASARELSEAIGKTPGNDQRP
ncbi:glycogen debranching protein GlgX [Luteolibacter sp. AS25]|uniref:glycogen debranching protein GlgX n=1 Tax=Luteolibacter sp. AS25 TaxID=3135776 RepID=UPI00398A939E